MAQSLFALEILPESMLHSVVDVIVRLVEACGVVIIAIGAAVAMVKFVGALVRRDQIGFLKVRLTLGRYLALGLEFQLASDILRTAISPSFEELGKLAAIAAIRTALNFFLAREIAEEQRLIEQSRETDEAERASSP